MTDDNLGADGLTEAGRQAQLDKAAAAAAVTGTAPPAAEVAQRDQAAAKARDDRNARRREAAAAERARKTAPAAPAAPADVPPSAQVPPSAAGAAPAAPEAEQPCEPCRQLHEAVSERLGRLETQVQAIGKLVVFGVAAGAVIYFMSARKPQPIAVVGVPEGAEIEAAPAAEPAGIEG